MFCPKCGTYNEENSSVCIRCSYDFNNIPENIKGAGRGFTESEIPQGETAKTEDFVVPDLTVQNEPAKKKKRKMYLDDVKDYFIQAILSAILCSIAFGIPAIIFSGMTQTEKTHGNIKKAESYSQKAKMFCQLALAVGIVKYLFIILLVSFAMLNLRFWF